MLFEILRSSIDRRFPDSSRLVRGDADPSCGGHELSSDDLPRYTQGADRIASARHSA